MWDQVPEERKRHAIFRQEFFEANSVCATRDSVRGGETALTMVQKGILDSKTKKIVD